MKSRFAFRKALKQVLDQIGIKDEPTLTEVKNPGTNELVHKLVNPQRMLMKAMLAKPFGEQAKNLESLKALAAKKQAERAADNKALENG